MPLLVIIIGIQCGEIHVIMGDILVVWSRVRVHHWCWFREGLNMWGKNYKWVTCEGVLAVSSKGSLRIRLRASDFWQHCFVSLHVVDYLFRLSLGNTAKYVWYFTYRDVVFEIVNSLLVLLLNCLIWLLNNECLSFAEVEFFHDRSASVSIAQCFVAAVNFFFNI